MDLHRVVTAAEQRTGSFAERLRELVSIDSGSYSADGVNRVADALDSRFREGGWEVDRRRHRPEAGAQRLGDLVIARVTGSGSHRVLLLCHMDTVFPDGTAAARPFRVEGNRGLGPGVSDAKAGILAGIEAVDLLRELGIDRYASVTFACNPDEEVGSTFSGPAIRELAEASDVAYVLEAGRENGDIVSARKGVTTIRVELTGRSAHAGVEPERGRHAVLDAALKTAELQALNGQVPGATVNVGVLSGGIRPNVVPDACVMEIDVRAFEESVLAGIRERVMSIVTTPRVAGVAATVQVDIEHAPMERLPSTERLVALAREIAGEIGFPLRDASTGGASDANAIAATGTPVLDGLGPVGGDDHGPAEWVDLSSVAPRVALLAGMVARADEALRPS
ncbi:MAG: M20 family metallopeptidase [Actinomycetota bacterium]